MGYIKGVFKELKQVRWPSFAETNRFTWIVILMIVFFGLYFALTDALFSSFISWLVTL